MIGHSLRKPVVDGEVLIRVMDALVEHKEVVEGVEKVMDGWLRDSINCAAFGTIR